MEWKLGISSGRRMRCILVDFEVTFPEITLLAIHVQDSFMFKGVQDLQDVQYSYILYQLISNGHNLQCYAFKMFRMFKIYILYAKLTQTDTQYGANITFILAVEHIEHIAHTFKKCI